MLDNPCYSIGMADSQNQQNVENKQNISKDLQYLRTPMAIPYGYMLIPYIPAINNMPVMPPPTVASSYNYASQNVPSQNTMPIMPSTAASSYNYASQNAPSLMPQNILPETLLIPNPITVSTIGLLKLPMIIFAVLLLTGFLGYKFLNNFITAQGQVSIVQTGEAITIPTPPPVETTKEKPEEKLEKEPDNLPAAQEQVKNDVAKILIPR
jgi:hypothetical protein